MPVVFVEQDWKFSYLNACNEMQKGHAKWLLEDLKEEIGIGSTGYKSTSTSTSMPVMYSFDALSSIQEWMTHTGLLSDTTRNHNGDDAEHLTP